MKYVLLVISILISTQAFAQVPNELSFLQKALGVLENQRNQALTNLTLSETKLLIASEDLGKANGKIKELEDKIKTLDVKKDE